MLVFHSVVSSSLETIVRRCVWGLLALCLAADGPLFEDLLSPPQDLFGFDKQGRLYQPEHLTRNQILFAGFVVLQGVLVLVVLRLRPPLQNSVLRLQAPKHSDSENATNP